MNLIIGIDTGKTGALAAITTGGEFVAVADMPLEPMGNKTGKKKFRVDPVGVADWFAEMMALGNITAVVIEKVGARPGQGVVSMFSFGDSFGAIRGVVGALNLPVEYVTPNHWKKFVGLIGSEKDDARLLAISLWGNAPLNLKKHHGRADALLVGSLKCVTVAHAFVRHVSGG